MPRTSLNWYATWKSLIVAFVLKTVVQTVTAPATAASAIQIEAYKKLTLIQLILYGEVCTNPSQFTSQHLTAKRYDRYEMRHDTYPG